MKSLPVFPVDAKIAGNLTIFEMRGMTLRDYFAAKAMEADIISMEGLDRRDLKADCKKTATIAYAMADAMMEARGE